MPRSTLPAACMCVALAGSLGAQVPAARPLPPAERQISLAVLAAPEDLRPGAAVLGYTADSRLVTLREGTNELLCLADDPDDAERFHVACYHRALEPFMARGREIRAQGLTEREQVDSARLAEISSGRLVMPDFPTALYSITAPADSVDAATATVRGGQPLYVVYLPYATPESTGIPAKPVRGGQPWLMSQGTPWAHIMIVP